MRFVDEELQVEAERLALRYVNREYAGSRIELTNGTSKQLEYNAFKDGKKVADVLIAKTRLGFKVTVRFSDGGENNAFL